VRVGIHVGHWEGTPRDLVPLAQAAERLGLDSVWTSETWGSDAIVLATWMASHTTRIGIGVGVAQMAARTPANAAMAALTLDHLSGGRLRFGLGASGPQVVEGWHGVVFDDPLGRTREYVDIVRAIWSRETPVTSDGPHYPLPVNGGTGLGRPLKTNVRPLRADIPLFIAAMGPRNVALTAEIAEGWLPLMYSPDHADAFAESLRTGFDSRERPTGLEIAPMVPVAVGDDLAASRDAVRPTIALYVGAYGSKDANFYNALVARYGYETEAAHIQDLFLDGKRAEAIAAVTDAMVDELALVGPAGRVADRMHAYRNAGVATLLLQVGDFDAVARVAIAADRGGFL